MRDVELYRHLLGLQKPWTVTRVEVSVADQRVDVWIGHRSGYHWPCPACGRMYRLHDHREERTWRHLDSCQYLTYLHARVPRVRCEEHGGRQVELPWADPKARFTALFECQAIDVLLETDVIGGARLLRISWDEAWHLLERAVERGLAAKSRLPPCRIGVDEKSIAKGQKYVTVVCDLVAGTVEYVGRERRQATLDAYFQSLPESTRAGIEAIAMDMWEPFYDSAVAHVPDATDKIVFDRYHVMTYLEDAVDKVRCQEHRELLEQGNGVLKGTKYFWLYNEENLPDRYREHFKALKQSNLKTARAWAIKENFRNLWQYHSRAWAERLWKRWYFWATHCRLVPIIEAARTIHRHIHNVLTYFRHRITNAMAEGLNSKIEKLKQSACGYRNVDNYVTAIFFYCGGLALHPVSNWNQPLPTSPTQPEIQVERGQLHLW